MVSLSVLATSVHPLCIIESESHCKNEPDSRIVLSMIE